MKKILQIPLLLVALFLTSIPISAYDFEVDGIYYNYLDKTAKTVCVTYGTYTGAVTIPSTVNYSGTTYSVTSISDGAFQYCSGLTSVAIGNSVTKIGQFVFSGCSGMASVTIGNSATSIGNGAFYGCKGLTSVTIPNSVTEIGSVAFTDCSGLTSVTIGNSVTSIGIEAFNYCSGLTSITIPNSVIKIGARAFEDCSGLTSVTIGNSVTEIGNGAFYGCKGLTKVTIPNSVTEIGDEAFYDCSGLTSVTIGNSVTSIGSSAFEDCSELASVTIGNSVTSIGYEAFYGCHGLTKVTIPNSVTSIADRAFYMCINLTVVNFNAENCTSTNSSFGMFYNCRNIKTVNIGDNVKNIPNYIFSGCSGMTSVTIGNSVTEIGNKAFYDCSGLTEINITDLSAWCKISFEDSYANPLYYAGHLKLNGTEITNLVIPDNITEIKAYAFYGCSSLTSVTIPNSVDTIGTSAFLGCSGLKAIVSLNPTPPSCYSGYSFSDYSVATLYVPKDSYAKYYIDDEWGKFTNIKKIETLATSIALNKTSITLDENATDKIFATITPSDASVSHLAWTSDNPQVATVDYKGKVTAIKAGEATITAKTIDGTEVSASCKVIVKGVETIITLSQTEAQLSVNDIMTLSYTAVPATTTVEWSTSDANVAPIKVNSNGSVTVAGIANGVATITAKATDGSGASASCVVTVGVSGIEGVETNDNAVEVARYDVHGRLLSEPTKGINIVKYSDGTVKKIIHN